MDWNRTARKAHRTLSIVFTLAVIVNIVLNVVPLASDDVVTLVGLVTLIPLALLMFTGLYLFVLPYVTTIDNGRRSDS